MRYLLDTDIIVDHLRKKEILKEEILEAGAAISVITLGELFYGAYKSDSPQKSLVRVNQIVARLGLPIENLSDSIMQEFGRVKVHLERVGERLEDFDLLIAATAKMLDLTLVTRNVKHFKRIKDLKLHA